MPVDISRRSLLKLGTFAGITVMLGRPHLAEAIEVNSSAPTPPWIGKDGKARFRWDAVRKVTGQKNFSRDFRARDLEGWPSEQSHAFMLKATKADRRFVGVDISMLGADLQPDRLLVQEDFLADGINIPADSGMGKTFYGTNILVPKGETPPLLGHPVAILIYKDFARFTAARRRLQFEDAAIIYGEETGPKPPPNYGVGRFVRVQGATPIDPPLFSPFQDAAVKGHFDGNGVIWPPFAADNKPGPVLGRDRGGGFITALKAAEQKPDTQGIGMDAVAMIEQEIADARNNPDKFVLSRHAFSQSIDPCAMEPDNCNVWYDAENRTLHILIATQSPAGIVSGITAMMKDNKKFPVETLVLQTGSTVGYGSKDYSVFPFYAVAAALYSADLPLRLANNRYDQFQMGMKRHSIEMDVTISGDRKTGQFEILQGSYNCNGGGRENLSVAVSHVGARGAQSIYYFPKSDLTAIAMATPAVEAGSMRGFGSLQSMAATEILVDEIAGELGLDPIELRRRNSLKPGDSNTQGGVAAGDVRLLEMLDMAAAHPLWAKRESAKKAYEAAHPGHRYGVGFAQVQQVYGSSGVPTALLLEFDANGRLIMRHCVQEIGTGATTAQQVMVWQAFGKAPDEVTFGMTEFDQLPLRTSYANQAEQDRLSTSDPYWTPSLIPDMSSSTSVYYLGFGTRQAARFLLEFSLWPAAQAIWSRGQIGGAISSYNISFADVRVGPDGIGGAGMRPLSFEELAKEAHAMGLITGVAVHAYSCWQWATAKFDLPGVGLRELPLDAVAVKYGDGASDKLKARMTTGGYDFIKRASAKYPPTARSGAGPTTYTPAGCLVELDVNTFTGRVKVLRHHMMIDPGTMIVPELVSGQVQGGTAMGLGHALMEYLPLYEDGPGNGTWNFNRYTLPRASDVAVWSQTVDYLPPLSETSPPKGMAELGMVPILPATANAIAHATGKRFYEFPINAERIMEALQ